MELPLAEWHERTQRKVGPKKDPAEKEKALGTTTLTADLTDSLTYLPRPAQWLHGTRRGPRHRPDLESVHWKPARRLPETHLGLLDLEWCRSGPGRGLGRRWWHSSKSSEERFDDRGSQGHLLRRLW